MRDHASTRSAAGGFSEVHACAAAQTNGSEETAHGRDRPRGFTLSRTILGRHSSARRRRDPAAHGLPVFARPCFPHLVDAKTDERTTPHRMVAELAHSNDRGKVFGATCVACDQISFLDPGTLRERTARVAGRSARV